MLDLIREIGQTLRNNKLRTILTGISVSWGIFMLIVLLGAARGVTNHFDERVSTRVNNMMSIWGGYTTMPYKGYKDGRMIQLKTSDLDAIVKDNEKTVVKAEATASNDTAKISTERDFVSGGFSAVFPGYAKLQEINVNIGRFINENDIAAKRKVMVLRDTRAELLFGSAEDALGKTVQSMGLGWTVVGIYTHRWERESYVPYTTYKAITGNTPNTNQIDVTLGEINTLEEAQKAEQEIRATLGKEHQFAAEDQSAVWTWNRFESYLQGKQGNRYLELAVWIIGVLTLLTGIVGVSNIMFVSVRERTHEIGIRRAIGAKPRAILSQVIAESVGMTTLFGYIGIVAGMIVLQIVDVLTKDVEGFTNPTVDISIAVKVTLALIIAGALAGLFPALNAIKVKPVEALRDE